MNKTDLIKMVAEKANKPTKEVAEIIDSFFKELSQNLREKDVSIKRQGFFICPFYGRYQQCSIYRNEVLFSLCRCPCRGIPVCGKNRCLPREE